MTSENPDLEDVDDIEPPPPPPPEPEEETAPEPVEKQAPAPKEENVWTEDYEEHAEEEEAPPVKPKRRRRYGATIVIVAIIIFLIVWTVLSPKVIPESGALYLRSSTYANLAGYSGSVDTYAGNVTWAVSVSGPVSSVPGAKINISVLLTKVEESMSSFFFIGFGVSVSNVSILDGSGAFLAKMTNSSDFGFGPLATIPLTVPSDLPRLTSWNLTASLRFLMYVDMRIGFLPVLDVNISPVSFSIYVA